MNKRKKIPDGIYDEYILCADCDNRVIGSLESYASSALFGKRNLSELESPRFEERKAPDGLHSIIISNLDYTKFKLFLLSILWRAHISKHAFFECINLGKYAEIIRRMIYENNPGNDDEFQTCLVIITSEEVLSKAIIQPRYLKSNGNSSYVFLINKIMYHFNISKNNPLPFFEKAYIGQDNIMQVVIPKDNIANEYFDSFLGKTIRLKQKY